jgi:uncharacterized membrane protein
MIDNQSLLYFFEKCFVPAWVVYLNAFLCLNFIVFGVKMVGHRYQERTTNIFFIAITALLIVAITILIKSISKYEILSTGLTYYPSLNETPIAPVGLTEDNKALSRITNVLIVVQICLIAILSAISMMTGRLRHSSSGNITN